VWDYHICFGVFLFYSWHICKKHLFCTNSPLCFLARNLIRINRSIILDEPKRHVAPLNSTKCGWLSIRILRGDFIWCSGQILTFIKIMTRVQTFGDSASLLAGLAHLQARHRPKRKPQALPWAHISSGITYPGPLLTRSCTTLRDAINQYKDPLLPVQWPFPEPLKALTLRFSGACYYSVTYSWTIRSPRFTDPATLTDHPHVLNIVTPLLQCGQLWIVTNISAWRSYNQVRDLGGYTEIITCGSCGYGTPRYSHPRR